MTPLQPGVVVWTASYTFHGKDLLTANVQVGFEPQEIVVDAGERVTVRSLTTGRYRVVHRNDLDLGVLV